MNVIISCSLLAFVGYCAGSSLKCTKQYQPVCGADGKIYSNPCVMRSAGVEKAISSSVCQSYSSPLICPAIYAPVCGTDGKVYGNECMMRSSDVDMAESFETCRSENHPLCPSRCTREYNPVCANDGKIYPTACVMQFQNCGKWMTKRAMEECQEQLSAPEVTICPLNFDPRCGVNGKVYDNECLLRAAKVAESESFETCRGADQQLCPSICTLEYAPVCGADGKIYGNACEMRSKNCGKLMFPRPMSECEDDSQSAPEGPRCTKILNPVCGADGKVYNNDCLMRFEQVEEADSFETCRKANHRLCPFICTMEYAPVCGSDGKIYATECVMRSQNCGNKHLMKLPLNECPQELAAAPSGRYCPMIYDPRCGTDGYVYGNDCLLRGAGVREADSFETCRKSNHPLCPYACTDEYRPVCGSDGKIYATECVMRSENCGQRQLLTLPLEECQDVQRSESMAACPKIYKPICGANGNVYDNDCLMRSVKVEEAESFETCRKANHPLCPFICTLEYAPVCGSDGKIYATECTMRSQNCGKRMTVRDFEECPDEE